MVTNILGPLFAAAGFIGIPLSMYWLGRWVLRPLDEAAKGRAHPMQFTIADFLCLFVLLQVSTAMVYWGLGPPTRATISAMWCIGLFAWAANVTFWLKGVEVMSRAGIRTPWRRSAFLLFVWPVTLLASAGSPVLVVGSLIAAFHRDLLTAGEFLLGAAGAVAGLYVSARLTRGMVAAAEADPPPAESP